MSLETAVQAAKKAGGYIKERLGNIDRIDYKSAYNLVTDVDKASEKLILDIIKAAHPGDTALAEESGGSGQAGGRRWLIDPLDGTTNFAHSYPFFCVSIALEIDGVVQVAAVFNPVSDELFTAEKGKGAFLNGKRMAVSTVSSVNESLLATGFPPDTEKAVENNIEAFKLLTGLSHGVRRDGSAALDLSYVACGRLDGFWELKLGAWDVAAGSLIVTESGGTVTDHCNGPLDIDKGHIVATNGSIHQQIIDTLAKVYAVAGKGRA